LPSAIGRLEPLQLLELKNTECTALPDSIGDLTRLNRLWLEGNPKLTRLPDRVTELQQLWSLTVAGTPLESLPEGIGALTRLSTLQLTGGSYERLPPGLTELKRLEKLYIKQSNPAEGGGQGLRVLPENFGDLQSLQELKLSRHPNLEEIPASLGHLERLKTLDISYCPKLTRLPPLGRLSSLEILILRANDRLVRLPEGLGNLNHLKKLDLSGCTRLRQLPVSLGRLPASCEIFVPHHLEEQLRVIRSSRAGTSAAAASDAGRPPELHPADPPDYSAVAPPRRPRPQPAAIRKPRPQRKQWKKCLEPFAGEHRAQQFSQWMDAIWRRDGRLNRNDAAEMEQIVAAASQSGNFRAKLFQFAAENLHFEHNTETGDIEPGYEPTTFTSVKKAYTLLLEHRMSDLRGTTTEQARAILGEALAERCRDMPRQDALKSLDDKPEPVLDAYIKLRDPQGSGLLQLGAELTETLLEACAAEDLNEHDANEGAKGTRDALDRLLKIRCRIVAAEMLRAIEAPRA
jgi:Leucine-rich repeat (LRR) protein